MKKKEQQTVLFQKIQNQTEALNQLMKEYCKETEGKLSVSVEQGRIIVKQEYRDTEVMMEELDAFFRKVVRAVEVC